MGKKGEIYFIGLETDSGQRGPTPVHGRDGPHAFKQLIRIVRSWVEA